MNSFEEVFAIFEIDTRWAGAATAVLLRTQRISVSSHHSSFLLKDLFLCLRNRMLSRLAIVQRIEELASKVTTQIVLFAGQIMQLFRKASVFGLLIISLCGGAALIELSKLVSKILISWKLLECVYNNRRCIKV